MTLAIVWVGWLVVLGVVINGLSAERKRATIVQRLSQLADDLDQRYESEKEKARKQQRPYRLYAALLAPTLNRLGHWLSFSSPAAGSLERQLLEAGHPLNMLPAELLGLKAALAMLGVLIAGLASWWLHRHAWLDLAPAMLALPCLLFLIPNFALRRMAAERRLAIKFALPDMLDLLIINIEAGIGLDGAIYRAVERLRMPLTDELNRVLAEVSAGKPRIQSLKEMAERLRIEDLSIIIASIHQAEQLGTGIAQALKSQAVQMRRRRSNELREMAAKLPTKLLFPIVLFIFPTLFMVLLGPGGIMLFRSGAF